MADYSDFKNNSEVVDVLSYVIYGEYGAINISPTPPKFSVKRMVKKLKQPQSTVSTKLKFLIENEVVIKDKWDFKPNWKVLVRLFQKEAKDLFKDIVYSLGKGSGFVILKGDDSNMRKEHDSRLNKATAMLEVVPVIFNECRVKTICEGYADTFVDGYLEKMSLHELVEAYVDALKRLDTSEFKNFGKDIVSVKEFFNEIGNSYDMKEYLFIKTEDELRWQKAQEGLL